MDDQKVRKSDQGGSVDHSAIYTNEETSLFPLGNIEISKQRFWEYCTSGFQLNADYAKC